MRLSLLLLIVLITACQATKNQSDAIYISGTTTDDIKYLTIGTDTIAVANGTFSDTISRKEDQYNYLKIDAWKWPKIVYLQTGKNIHLNFQQAQTIVENDILNTFLLNKDTILVPYTAKWNMEDQEFRAAWEKEFPANLNTIDKYFATANIPAFLINEVKQMEYMLRGHLTANFISFQERKGKIIDRNIYDFVKEIDLSNDRLAFHENNRNFQYYYYLDQVSAEVPDSIYPFAAIDTITKYVASLDIQKMMIKNVVKSGLYEESVNHDALFKLYEQHIGKLSKEDKIVALYQSIQDLKPGNLAPGFGSLKSPEDSVLTIAHFKGKNILLSAWGTWCPYCKEELPHLKKLMSSYPDKLESVAISLDKDSEKWKTYLKENNWQGVHLIDPKRPSTFKQNYLISGTNIYYLIDKNGILLSSKLKPSNQELKVLIEQLE